MYTEKESQGQTDLGLLLAFNDRKAAIYLDRNRLQQRKEKSHVPDNI